MKLTKMADGRILLEVAGRAHALSAFELAQLADQLGVATEPYAPRLPEAVAVVKAARSWVEDWDRVVGQGAIGVNLPASPANRVLYAAVVALNKTEGQTA